MANRSYLYALSHPPTRYQDRPERIVGLSEWNYDVPFVYYLLLSGNTRLCASLITDGFEDDAADAPTPIYALTGDFAIGVKRLKRFAHAVKRAAPSWSVSLRQAADNAQRFLDQHKDSHFLLETIELDCMDTNDGEALRARAEQHVAAARAAGAAVDRLWRFKWIAGWLLQKMVVSGDNLMAPFRGLSLGKDFDDARAGRVMGMGFWTNVLYFALMDRQAFEAHQARRMADDQDAAAP